jgi:lysophospholipase L1-like esterase
MRAPALASVGRVTTIGAAPAMTGLCWAFCALQARRARRAGRPYVDALPASGLVGAGLGHDPVRITWLGDSLAAGLGCDDVTETPAHLSARLLERPVDISMLAVPGARVAHVLDEQLPLLDHSTDIVVLCVGANDVAGGTSRRRYAAALDEVLTRLAPIPTVVLTLPDITMADRIGQPLRTLAGARARLFEWTRAEVAAAHAHVSSVDIASRPAGLSRRAGRTMLCADRFHPGPLGYRVWAERIATVCHALLEPPAIPTIAD